MSKMITDDPILRKRLDDAAQRARDQELKIIILEKEIEQLKAGSTRKSSDDSIPSEKECRQDKPKESESSGKAAPPKAGFRDDVAQKSKESKNQAADSKQSHATGGEGRSSDKSGYSIPQSTRRTK